MTSIPTLQGKILWLASYPKSGNTWFRAFLTALLNDGDVEINKMKSDGIFSDRIIFDYLSEIDSRELYDSEAKSMLPEIYRQLNIERNKLNIIKVHDAFETDEYGQKIIPEDATHCAIYFIRNPLDIAGSLANHLHASIDHAVNMLNDKKACLAKQENNLNKNPQFRQNLLDWSGHVISWTTKPSFPVCVLRYEDMLTDTFATFSKAVEFVGWNVSKEQIEAAIIASSFERLSKQEAESGFREKFKKSPIFFRTGTKGNWEKELSDELIKSIITSHEAVMKTFNYQ